MINQLQGIWIICSVVLQIHVMLLDAWKNPYLMYNKSR